MTLARVHAAQGRAREAAATLAHAQRLEPEAAREFRRQFDLPLGAGRATPQPQSQAAPMAQGEQALQALEAAVTGGTGEARDYQQLSLAYAKVGRLQEALAASRQAELMRRRQRA